MPVDPTVLEAMSQRLADQLTVLASGQDWLDFLNSSRQFHRYSPHNQMLLLIQGAEGHVAGYRTWQRIPAQGGGTCQVRKGEKALVVLAPMTITRREVDEITGEEVTVATGTTRFKPVKVFHQAQLVAAPDLPAPPLPELLTGANRHQHVWGAVQSELEALGYTVDKVSRSPVETWNGRTDFIARHVAIGDHLQPPAALKTLFHEWAHIALDHQHTLTGERDLQEVEAESVAYMLCATVGVDSSRYSVPYLASWSNGDPTLLQTTAERTLAVTAAMIATLEHELSIDLTPDLFPNPTTTPPPARQLDPGARYWGPINGEDLAVRVSARRADAAVSVAPDEVVGQHAPIDTPLLDAARGEIRHVMAGLMDEQERRRLLDALGDLDEQLNTAIELFHDAGFTSTRTARFLLNETHLAPDTVAAAMIADELDHHPFAAEVPPDERAEIAAEAQAAIAAVTSTANHESRRATPTEPRPRHSGPLNSLSDADRYLLTHMDLTRSDCLTEACRALHDAGWNIEYAHEVLTDLHVDPDRVAAALTEKHYNAATGRPETLWTTPNQPGLAAGHEEAIGDDAAPLHVPPHHVIQRIAASGEPLRLAQLSDDFGLDATQSIALWASAGLPTDVVASATIATHHGDISAAVADLDTHWPAEPVDWQVLTAAATVPAHVRTGTSAAIVKQWTQMAPPTPPRTPAPEMA
jgi:hypothetical protein